MVTPGVAQQATDCSPKTPREYVLAALDERPGFTTSLRVIKASTVTDMVKPVVAEVEKMVADGELIQVRKGQFALVQ